MDIHARNKAALAPFRAALYNFDKSRARSIAAELFQPGAPVHLSHPYNNLTGQSALLEAAILPMAQSFPDLERRDAIVVAGQTEQGEDWVGCAGCYLGTFTKSWMTIPPTQQVASVRFHEFYRFENGQVAEVQALWDVADVMKQAGCWPLSPSLAREWTAPGPASGDGLRVSGDGAETLQRVREMLAARVAPGEDAHAAHRLEAALHPRFNWYGPAGIGTTRGLLAYRRWHRIPFLRAMPDRRGLNGGNLFAEGDYAAFTAWPGMKMTLSGDGWLGLQPSGVLLTMRSLEFWRLEDGRVRETWALIDLLDIYRQLGVDVIWRMQELTGQADLDSDRPVGAA